MNLRPRQTAAFVVAMTVATAAPAAADKIKDAMEGAIKAYDNKAYSKAVTELQYAVTKIGELLGKAFVATFPDPPEGWTARRVRRQRSTAGVVQLQGQILSRRYQMKGGSGRVTAQMIVNNRMMQAYTALMANPAYARQAGYDRVKIEGLSEPAMMKFDEDRKRGELIYLSGGRLLIRLAGRNLEDTKILESLIRTWKIAEARKLAGLK